MGRMLKALRDCVTYRYLSTGHSATENNYVNEKFHRMLPS